MIGERRPLLRLGVGLFFAQSAFNIYGATLPLYFAGLGFDPTLIGLLIGATGVAELIGALLAGPGIDRLGGRSLLLAGTACYLVASLGFAAFTAVPVLVLLRLIQGFGLAAVVPSTYSFVPHLARARAQTVAFASLGASGNVAAAICPPLGIALLQNAGPQTLFVVAAGLAALAAMSASTVPAAAPSRRPFGLTFRRAWLMPLLVAVLSVAQWGVIQAFVPIEASAVGSNPGLLFTADAVAVLASRIPAGWIADRYGPFRLALVGVILMALSPCVLLLPLNDGVLIAGRAPERHRRRDHPAADAGAIEPTQRRRDPRHRPGVLLGRVRCRHDPGRLRRRPALPLARLPRPAPGWRPPVLRRRPRAPARPSYDAAVAPIETSRTYVAPG